MTATRDGSSTLPGFAAVAAAAALWAVAAVVARRLFDEGVDAVELTESRAVLAAVGFALVPGSRRRPAGGGAMATVIGLGLALALVNVTYYVAVSRIPVAVALVIQYTAPALVVGWTSAVTRRSPSIQVLVALLCALGGVSLVMGLASAAAGRLDGTGVVLAVVSAFAFAAYTMLAERAGRLYGSSGAMFRGFVAAALLWIVFQAPRGVPSDVFDPANLPEVLFLGVAGTLMPFFLFAWGIARVRAERAAIVATLEPVIAAAVAWVWLEQRLTASQLAGGALVVAAVGFLQVRRRQPVIPPEGVAWAGGAGVSAPGRSDTMGA